MNAIQLPIRPELAGIRPYGAPQLDVPHRLNVNENPYPPSQAMAADIRDAVAQVATGLNRYPDRDFVELRAALAAYLARESGVVFEVGSIWAANGSNEVMTQLLQAFGGHGRSVLVATPSYSMYPEYARDTGTRFLQVPRDSGYRVDVDATIAVMAEQRPSVLIIPSPNNPTGTALPLEDARALAEAGRVSGPDGAATVVVIDEAYAEFRREGIPSALELVATHPNVAVSRTMSKAFGMAGLRLGYLAAQPDLVDALQVVRLPYHLSALTQAAALAALAHTEEQLAQVASLRRRRDDLLVFLRSLGLTALDSDANFCMFGTFVNRHAVFEALLARGVLIREVGPQGYLRVSVGTEAEDAAFRQALKEVLS